MKHLLFLMIIPFILYSQNSVEELIAEADNAATVVFDNTKALNALKKAESLEPGNYNVLWRLSRTYVDIGEHLPATTDEEKQKQLDYYQKSLDYANNAIHVNPNDAEGYVRRAISNGRVALFKGVWSAIDFVKQVRSDCEKAIMLNPNHQSVYYILGRTHAKLCEKPKVIRWPLGLGWANMDDAIKNYEKSISLRPGFAMYRLDAAKAYISEENFEKAKEHLRTIASLTKQDEDDDNFKKEAADLLEQIKDK